MTSQIFGYIRDGVLYQGANADLIVCLMSVMPDRTIFAFSRTCWLIYELAKPQMKRRKLRFQYTNFTLHNAYPCRLFELLEEQPEALPYIKTLSCQTDFVVTEERIREWRESFCRVQRGRHDDIPPFIRQFCALPYMNGLSDSELRDLETRNDIWKDVVILASSTLCRNLEFLHIEGRVAQIAKAITPIVRCMQNIENDRSAYNQSDAIAGKLAMPQWLTLMGEFSNTGTAEILRIFSLPSFRRAIVSEIRILGFPGRTIRVELDTGIPASNIERLTLTQCNIKPGSLKALIEHMPNLEWLRHHDVDEYENYLFLPNLPIQDLGVSDENSLALDMALRSLRDIRFHETEGVDAYAKLLVLHISLSTTLLRRDLRVSAVADELLDWDRPSIIVKKPHISSRDIGYGTLDRPRFV